MHILLLTVAFVITTLCPISESGNLLHQTDAWDRPLVCQERIEVRFDSNNLVDGAAIFSDTIQIIYDEKNKPLEGKDLYLSTIDYISEMYYPELDIAIVQAVMEIESNYDPNAGNPSGAIGLMQIIPKWHRHRAEKYGLHDLWDPYTNVLVGMDLLNESYQKYGDYRQALYVYNHSWSYVDHVMCLADRIRGGD